jgi:hypothetical protein
MLLRRNMTAQAAAKRPSEILGNKEAPHVIRFEYCGG